MARAKARRRTVTRYVRRGVRRAKRMTLPIALIAGVVPGLSRLWTHFTNPGLHGQANGFSAMGVEAGRIYLGLDTRTGQFDMRLMALGTGPILLGAIVHKFIGGTLGVNRMLARTGIPLLRL